MRHSNIVLLLLVPLIARLISMASSVQLMQSRSAVSSFEGNIIYQIKSGLVDLCDLHRIYHKRRQAIIVLQEVVKDVGGESNRGRGSTLTDAPT